VSSDPNAEIDDETGDKIIGFVIAGALALAQWPAFSAADALGERRMAAVANLFEDGRFFWAIDNSWSLPAVATCFLPFVLIPGAFGVQSRQLTPNLAPVWRWRLVLGLAAAAVLAHGLNAWQERRDLGVATASEAVWLRDGEVERRVTWAGATGVEVSCAMVQPRRGQPYPSLSYDVAFDDGRAAPLARTVDADASAWLEAVAPIDAALRAARVARAVSVDPECLAAYADELGGGDVARLGAVMVR
jgi:hypothetical protein